MPVNHAGRVDVHLVGGAGHVVGSLSVSVAVGYDEFLGFLFEVVEESAQFLQGSYVRLQNACFQIDAFYLVVLGSYVQCLAQGSQSLCLNLVGAQQGGKR